MLRRVHIVALHALRDLRGSTRHFRLLFVCLCLGVTVMACIGSTIQSIKSSVERDAKALLGGDIEIRQIYRPVDIDVTAYIMFNQGTLSRSADMRVMAEGMEKNRDKRILVELKGNDENYPLYGNLKFSKTIRDDVFFSNWRGKIHGAAVDQSLLDALNLKLGDIFLIGNATLRATAVIAHEPDRSINSISFGPRVMVNMATFKATGLAKETSMVNYRFRVRLPEGIDATAWKNAMKEKFPNAYWNIRDWRDNTLRINQQIDRLSLFFVLTAMTTLIVAGIGISNAASTYMWGKRHTIATMKCLGATQSHIRSVYLLQLCMVAIAAIIYGLILGALGNLIVLHFLVDVLPVSGDKVIYPEPMALSAALGFLTLLLFTLIPLQQAKYIRPTALLRGYADYGLRANRNLLSMLVMALLYSGLIGLMVWLSVLFTQTLLIPVYFAAGLAASLAILYLISLGVKHTTSAYAHSGRRSFATSMALANLSRPGAATTSVVIALGIGMSVLTALSLVSNNLRDQLERSLPENAPAFFLLDVQPSERESLTRMIQNIPEVKNIDSMPIIRGSILRLKDVPADRASIKDSAGWAVNNPRGLTFASTPPENSVIVDGTWWKPDYSGPPLVSFDAKLAHDMGLTLGDTITISAMGKEITATITNLRDIAWGTLEMNFTTIFSPGALDDLPVTYLTSIEASPSAESMISDYIAKQHPGVGVIRVREALKNVSDFVRQIANAIYFTASLTLLCGTLVMASAIHATLFRRKFDTVMMKVIGMTRKQIMRIYIREFCLASLVAAIIAILIGSASAYGIMQLLIFSRFTLMPDVILLTIAGSISIALLLGMAATRYALRIRPLSLLRND